ncbi:MAG: hypothetical protein FJ267_13750 [Planctomycetes bacterium]|nr:hypothetical protein [Planctomycetota bacterium]
MITELIEYLVTPCSWTFRKIGYLRGQLGIKVRHRQCQSQWKPHLERTKQAIMTATRQCARRNRAVILGSGLLLDVPLKFLAKEFREVVLVDVVHPVWVRLVARWYGNVRLIQADVTGTSDELAKVASSLENKLPRPNPTLFKNDLEVDYVASVNLLSQLPYLPSLFLEKECSRTELEINAYSRELILSHLEYLKSLPGVVSLITDVDKLKLDRQGGLVERFDIIYGVKLPTPDEEWTWSLVPMGHASKEFAYHRRVCCLQNVKDVKQVPPPKIVSKRVTNRKSKETG